MRVSLKNPLREIAVVLVVILSFGALQAENFDAGALDRTPRPQTVTGVLDQGDPRDRVSFHLGTTCQVTLLLTPSLGNADLVLLDGGGRVLARSKKGKTRTEKISRRLQAGDYTIEVSLRRDTSAGYRLEASAEFVPDDVVISGKVNIQDPEFDAVTGQVAWRDMNHVLVTTVNPVTGFFEWGNRLLLASDVAVGREVVNGPEWSSVPGGDSRILYTRSSSGSWSICQVRRSAPGGAWVVEAIPGTDDAYRPIGSEATDLIPPFMKFTLGGPGGRNQGNGWMALDPPYAGRRLPEGAEAGRFVPGERAIVYSRGVDGYMQLVWHDLDTDAETVMTTSPSHKIVPFAIRAPEFGGDVIVTASETTNILERGYFEWIGVYRQIDGVWTRIGQIVSPSPHLAGVHSAEPFVFGGKSYLSFLALNAIPREEGARKANAEVWISGLDPEEEFLRKVSGDARISRSDPETLVLDHEVFLYYTEIGGKICRQHRARTGLVER